MNEIQPKFQVLPIREFPVQSEEDLSYATEKNPGESLLIREEEEKMKDSVAPQHVGMSNFEIEEEEEGETIKQDKVNEAEKYLKLYPKVLWFSVIGTLILGVLLFALTFYEDTSDYCRRGNPEIIAVTNTERILYWLCHFCCFVMVGFQIAYVYSVVKAVQKRDYAQSLFAFKMMTGYVSMFGLIIVILCNGYPLKFDSCSLPDILEKFMLAMVSGAVIFCTHICGICKVRSSLLALAQYGKISLS